MNAKSKISDKDFDAMLQKAKGVLLKYSGASEWVFDVFTNSDLWVSGKLSKSQREAIRKVVKEIEGA